MGQTATIISLVCLLVLILAFCGIGIYSGFSHNSEESIYISDRAITNTSFKDNTFMQNPNETGIPINDTPNITIKDNTTNRTKSYKCH